MENTYKSSLEYETQYTEYKQQIEDGIKALMDQGMTAEQAGISVLTGRAITGLSVARTAGYGAVKAVGVIENVFQVSFQGKPYSESETIFLSFKSY